MPTCVLSISWKACSVWLWPFLANTIPYKPSHSISYKIADASSEDLNQNAHRIRTVWSVSRWHAVYSQGLKASSSWCTGWSVPSLGANVFWLEMLCSSSYLFLTLKSITKTCLYNFDPLKPHFYIVKLGFTGVYIIFLISAQNIDCGYTLEPPRRGGSRRGGSNEYPQSIFWAEM